MRKNAIGQAYSLSSASAQAASGEESGHASASLDTGEPGITAKAKAKANATAKAVTAPACGLWGSLYSNGNTANTNSNTKMNEEEAEKFADLEHFATEVSNFKLQSSGRQKLIDVY